MAAYLSDEWFARAGDLLRQLTLDGEARFALAVTQHVTTGDGDADGHGDGHGHGDGDGDGDGDVVYHVSSRPSGATVRLARGAALDEDVRFTTDLATAAAIASGRLNAQQAFVDGRLVVRGDVERLLLARELLTTVDTALAPLRAVTRYPD